MLGPSGIMLAICPGVNRRALGRGQRRVLSRHALFPNPRILKGSVARQHWAKREHGNGRDNSGERPRVSLLIRNFMLRESTRRRGQWRTIAYVSSCFRSSSFNSRSEFKVLGLDLNRRLGGFDKKLAPPPIHLIFALCCPNLCLNGKRAAGSGLFIHTTWFATLNELSSIPDNIGVGEVVHLLQSPSFLIFSARSLSPARRKCGRRHVDSGHVG